MSTPSHWRTHGIEPGRRDGVYIMTGAAESLDSSPGWDACIPGWPGEPMLRVRLKASTGIEAMAEVDERWPPPTWALETES